MTFPFTDIDEDHSIGDVILPAHTENPAIAANALKDDLYLGGRIYDVRAYGAVGDGSTNDSTAVQAAFTAAGADTVGATVLFPANHNFLIATGITITRQAATVPIWVRAHGATISYSGSSALFTFEGGGAHPSNGGIHFRGGRYINTGTGTTCFHMTDCMNSSWRDIYAADWDTAASTSVFRIRNDDAYTENVSFERIWNAGGCSRLATYEGVDVTGGSGTNSFARQRWHNVFVNGATDYVFHFSDSSSVYGSWFTYIGGNVTVDASEAIFRLGGGMSGTRFDHIDFEGTGAIFDPDNISTNAPTAGPHVSVRSGMTLRVPSGSETKLSSWEAGTWTPVITQSGTVTHTVTTARYQRQGAVMEVWANLAVTGSGTSSNDVSISGMPGTASHTAFPCGEFIIQDVSETPDLEYRGFAWMTASGTLKASPTGVTTNAFLGSTQFTAGLASGDLLRFHARYPITVD